MGLAVARTGARDLGVRPGYTRTGVFAGVEPKLDLNFAASGALDSRITFTRADAATCATRFNQAGKLETVAANIARFDYDPSVVLQTNYGVELVTNGDFSNGTTGWSFTQPTSGSATISSGVATLISNDGTNSAIYQGTPVAGRSYFYQVTVVSSTGVGIVVTLGGVTSATFSIAGTYTGTLVAISTAPFEVKRAGITNTVIDNISVREITNVCAPRGLLIEEARTNLLLHSRDMTQAAWAKTDVTPARTQVGLDGTANTACLMTEGSAGTSGTLQVANVTAAQTHTLSWVVKRGNTDWVRITFSTVSLANGGQAWFNLGTGVKGIASAVGAGSAVGSNMISLGGGWYRCSVTATVADAAVTMNTNIYAANADGNSTRVSGATYILDCAQLEVGAFATSIIVTDASTKTRAADSASMTGTNFSSWWNATEGSFVAEADQNQVAATQSSFIFSADDGVGANRFYTSIGGGIRQFFVDVSSVPQCTIGTGVPAIGVVQKISAAYKLNDFSTSQNGSVVSTDASGTLPTVNAMRFGVSSSGAAGSYLNGHIRRLTYYNKRLPDSVLRALTL